MKKLIHLLKSTSSSIGNQGVLMMGNFVLFILLTKGMPTALLSQFILFQAISSVIDYARLALFQNAFINLYHDKGMEKSLIRTVMILFIISILLSMLIFLIIYLIISFSEPVFAFQMLGYYALNVIGLGTLQFISIILLAKQQNTKIFWNNFISQLSILGTTLFIFFYYDQLTIVHVVLISFLSTIYPICKHLPKIIGSIRGVKFSNSIAKQFWSFGKYALGSNTLSLLVSKSDIFIVSIFTNPLNIAIYNIAQKLNNYFEVPLTAITQYYYPRAKQVSSQPQHLKYYLNQSILMQLIFIIPAAVCMFVVARPILTVLTLPAYVDQSVIILRVLLLASVIRPIGRTIGSLFDINYRPDLNLSILLLNAFLFVFLEIALIIPYGIVGLAVAYILSTYISTIVSHSIVKKKFQLSFIHELSKTLKNKLFKNHEIINIKLR